MRRRRIYVDDLGLIDTGSAGVAVATADGYIAAIAAANGFAVATRDTAPFEVAGVAVVNPWLAS